MTTGRTLAVTVLLVLAGCGGVSFGGDDAGTNTVAPALEGTPSPTPTPTPTPTPGFEERLPPGITTDSVDTRTLASSHEGEVERFSRTTVRTVTYIATNGTTLASSEYRTETELIGSRSRILVNTNTTGVAPRQVGVTPANISYWGNGSVSGNRRVQNGSVEVNTQRGPLPALIRSDTTGRDVVFLAFSSVELTNVTALGEVDGRQRFQVQGRADSVGTLQGSNATLSAVVSEIGIVHQFRFAYTAQRQGRTVRIVQTFRLVDFKNTTAPPPEWFTAAHEAN